jgi:hypothetical protein
MGVVDKYLIGDRTASCRRPDHRRAWPVVSEALVGLPGSAQETYDRNSK